MRAFKAVLLVTYIPYCVGFATSGWWVKSGRRRFVKSCLWSSIATSVRPANALTENTGACGVEGEKAIEHLVALAKKKGTVGDLLLRMGVKSGGCSGLSYDMDFMEDPSTISEEDTVETYEQEDGTIIKCIIDPKSLLYLFGMRLDFSDALIGGGFQFHNPNSVTSCGCGKSFGV